MPLSVVNFSVPHHTISLPLFTRVKLKTIVSDPSEISLKTVHVLSEKKISCETLINQEKYVILINPTNPDEKTQIKMNADSVAPHPTQTILAVRGGKAIQIFNLSANKRIAKCSFSESIDYMTWTDETHLGIVTTSAAFLLDISKDDEPKQIFERHSSLENHVIVNFQADKSNNWYLLHGNIYDV